MKKTQRILGLLLCMVLAAGMSMALAERDPWDCPKCGRKGNTGNFCGSCGEPAPEALTWDCPKCGATGNTDRFCGSCGQKAPETWSCPVCGKKSNSKTFCEACGIKNPALIQAGDSVLFGHYEQDNNTANGPEQIEWLVLDVRDGNVLLLSKYALDGKPYNAAETGVTWETCSLRTWLNGEFLYSAFSDTERKAILTTETDNSQAQGYSGYSTGGGRNTRDLVFLLSFGEANRFLGVQHYTSQDKDNIRSRTSPTRYAKAQGADTHFGYQTAEGEDACWWWLRSPGPSSFSAANVYCYGACGYQDVNWIRAVRPALWLDLSSDSF